MNAVRNSGPRAAMLEGPKAGTTFAKMRAGRDTFIVISDAPRDAAGENRPNFAMTKPAPIVMYLCRG